MPNQTDTGAARLQAIRERLNAWRDMDVLAGTPGLGPNELCHCPFCELTTHASGDLAFLLAENDRLRRTVAGISNPHG